MGKFVGIAGVIAIIGLIAIFFTAGESPNTAANNFMAALMKRDVESLTNLTFVSGETPEQVRDQWAEAMKYNKNYRFTYRLEAADQVQADSANVKMQVTKNISQTAYEEGYTLPMVKKDGHWKVDLQTVNRLMYPFLPRV